MKKLYTLLLLVFSLNCCAQYRDLYFEHLNVENGLPENMINVLMQDKLGYIWIGTQNGLVRYDGYQVKVYTLGSEIKNESKDYGISEVVEDKKGVLWVLTRSLGLFRYNRETDDFTQCKPGTIYSYYDSMICDDHDNIWIRYYAADNTGNVSHLEKFNTKNQQFTALPWLVTGMAKSSTGNVWFGTSKGLACYQTTTGNIAQTVFAIPGAPKTAGIYSLYEPASQPGILYFSLQDAKGAGLGLCTFDTRNRHFKHYTHNPALPGSLPTDTINTVYEDRQKRLWVGTRKGISLMDRVTGTFRNYSPADIKNVTYENQVGEIKERPDGKFWLSTTSYPLGDGLLLFDPDAHTFSRFTADSKKPHALNVDGIMHLLVDRTGQLWTGLVFGGVDRVNNLRSQFDLYKNDPGRKDSYPASDPNGIAQTADGFCWLGSAADGLSRWKPGTDNFERIKLPAYITSGRVGVRLADRDGVLWCLSNKCKLFTYNPKTAAIDTFKDKSHLPPNFNVILVYQDHTGTIWIGTHGDGLFSYDKNSGKFTAWPYEKNTPQKQYKGNKLDQGQVISLYEDKESTLWIGTNLGGLNRFNRKEGTFTSFFDATKGLNCVPGMYEDKAGRFWVGTYLSGQFLFDRKTGNSRLFTEKDGLLINDAAGMLEDKKGNLWIYSNRGLSVMDPETKTFTNYTKMNALSASIYHRFDIKLADGRFVFAAADGMTVLDPDHLQKNPFPPQVQVEALSHNDPQAKDDTLTRMILYGRDKVELPHNQNRITFNYVALHYSDPANNKYAYWLAGYDHHLVQAGAQRSATYTNLSPGTYTFHVTASSSDGVWNKKGASIEIIIYPPWWFTWWAWVIYIIVFVATVYAFVAYRSRKLMRDKRVLEHKVHVRTEEVMQQKEEIEAQRDEIEKAFGELKTTQNQLVQREKMASLGELTAGIAHEIQNPLNFVNNFSEVNTELITELSEERQKRVKDEQLQDELIGNIKENLVKISHHGKRADFIVKGMLEHSRTGKGEKTLTNINVLADEFFRLSYHGLRAKDKNFNAELITNFDGQLPKVEIVQQDIGRVLLNLFNNAFYAVNQKQKTAGPDYKPTVELTTFAPHSGGWGVKVKDNGNGIPDAIKGKIMQPFFTTKPTGEGTGLGLSLSYDIVVKGHGGDISTETKEGAGSEFTITLPLTTNE
jgi:signal transduction histidine kinase/ligand-binding sensor domain-containing protein